MCRLSINRPPAIIIRSSRRSCWIKVCNRTICISTRPRILINRNASSCYSLFRLLMESGSGSLSRFHAAAARRLSPPLRENLPNRGEKSIALWRYGLSRDPFSAEAVNLGRASFPIQSLLAVLSRRISSDSIAQTITPHTWPPGNRLCN